MDDGKGVDGADALLGFLQLPGSREVALVEDDHIGKCHLLLGLVRLADMSRKMMRVHHRHHAIHHRLLPQFLIHKESLHHRSWISQAGRLDQDVVELVAALHEVPQDADQIPAHRATNAPVVHFKQLLLGIDDQFMVDANLAKFIFDHRNPESVFLPQNAIQESGFPGPKEAGKNGDWYA